jgi:hypothetical protein
MMFWIWILGVGVVVMSLIVLGGVVALRER